MVAVMIEDVDLAKRSNDGGGCGHYRYPKRHNDGDGDDCSGEAPTSGGGDGGGIPPTGGDGGSDDPPTPGDDGADETPNPGDVGGDETPGPVDGTPNPGDDGGDIPPPTPGDETGGTPPNPGGDGTGEIPPTPGGGDRTSKAVMIVSLVQLVELEVGEPAEKGLVVGGLEVEVPEVELEAKEQGVEELEVEPEAGERGEEEPEAKGPGFPQFSVTFPSRRLRVDPYIIIRAVALCWFTEEKGRAEVGRLFEVAQDPVRSSEWHPRKTWERHPSPGVDVPFLVNITYLQNTSSVQGLFHTLNRRMALQSFRDCQPGPDRTYYATFYNQFSNVIMISTFTGGVQAAILSFMNDLLGGEDLKTQLFDRDPVNPGRVIYTSYSLGLMLGLLAIALNLAVAATAAVNAALACHFSLHTPQEKISMEARIVFCMLVQFIASGVAGTSLILLCIGFDLAFTIVTAVLFFSGIVVSGYHLVSLFGSKWFTELKGQPLHSVSLFISTIAFSFDVLSPSPASWFTITTYGFTAVYHMLAVLQYYIRNKSHATDTPSSQDRGPQANMSGPGRLATFAVFVISGLWGGCVALTLTLRYTRFEGKVDMQGEVVKYVIAALAGLEALVCFAIGVFNLGVRRGLWGTRQGTPEIVAPTEADHQEDVTPSGKRLGRVDADMDASKVPG
ncbi:hypothetical protein NMY22_g1047 [Coprinellus aureogranulatus]|nr:hypothetical protein NMY22_g1047 [Coprinellus aureogranulatus]